MSGHEAKKIRKYKKDLKQFEESEWWLVFSHKKQTNPKQNANPEPELEPDRDPNSDPFPKQLNK